MINTNMIYSVLLYVIVSWCLVLQCYVESVEQSVESRATGGSDCDCTSRTE